MKKIFWILIVYACLACNAEINILKIFPFMENGQKGYLMISREIKISRALNYHIVKCDADMKPVLEITEERANTDAIASFAFNQKVFCLAFQTNGNLELSAYDKQLRLNKRFELTSNGMWERAGTAYCSLTTDGESGFILNKYTVKDKQVCTFIKYDNNLNKIWEYSSSLGFDKEHITPTMYLNSTDTYFYNYVLRKKKSTSPNGENSILIVNNCKDGSLSLQHEFRKEGVQIIETPAVLNGGKEEVALFMGDYLNKKAKERGIVLVKMDIKAKNVVERYLPLNSEEFIGKLNEQTKTQVNSGKISVHPYSIQRLGEKFIMVGELYQGDLKAITDFGTSGTKSGDIIIAEFDKDLNLVKVVLQSKKTDGSPTLVCTGYRDLYFYHALLNVEVKGQESVNIQYVDYNDKAFADYCSAEYKNGTLSIKRKKLTRNKNNTALNVYAGTGNKVNVIKVTNQFVELVQE